MSDALLTKYGQQFSAGTVLFHEGDPGEQMYVVQSGRVELTRRLGGRDAHLCFVPPGEFFGEMAIVNQRPRSATAVVVEDSWLLVIDARTFEAMIKARAEIAVRMIRLLSGRLEQANRTIELLLVRDADHRVVRYLWQLAESMTPIDEVGLNIAITSAEVAGKVALSVETVDEIVGRLADNRLLIRNDDGFLVPEVGRLADFLEFLEMKERFMGA